MALVEQLAEFIHDLTYDELPQAIIQNTKQHILDAFGVGFHGRTLDIWDPVIRTLKSMDGKGDISVFGYEEGLPAHFAAFINGMMMNASAYQETHRGTLTHPHSCAFAAALALGEEMNASGEDLILATVAGYEPYLRVSNAVCPSYLSKGLQTSGGMASIGSSAACGKLMGLTLDQMVDCLAHGVHFAGSGLVEAHCAKPYISVHNGANIWKGFLAAKMAKENIRGCETILEGGSTSKYGFLQAYPDTYDERAISKGLGERFEILQTGFSLNCVASFSRTPIDAAITLVKENNLSPDQIKSMHVKVTNALFNFVQSKVSTASESARESYYYIPFHIALAVLKGRVESEMYTDENMDDPEIKALMEKVQFSGDQSLDDDFVRSQSTMTSLVEVETTDGRHLSKKLDFWKGNPENPATQEELEDKFMRLATRIINPDAASQLMTLCNNLEAVDDISDMARLIRSS